MIPSVSTLTLDTEAFPDWWTNFLWSTLIGKYNSQSPWAVLIGQMGLDKKKEQGSSFKVTHEKRQCTDAWYRKGMKRSKQRIQKQKQKNNIEQV